jgi:hypothetical protein
MPHTDRAEPIRANVLKDSELAICEQSKRDNEAPKRATERTDIDDPMLKTSSIAREDPAPRDAPNIDIADPTRDIARSDKDEPP